MKRAVVFGSLAVAVLVLLSLNVVGGEKMAFGGKEDVEFANKLWKAMEGYDMWLMKSDVMPGKSPHGAFVRLYYNIVNVDEKPYHVVIMIISAGKMPPLRRSPKPRRNIWLP